MLKTISLAHGGGGLASTQLIEQVFMRAFNNPFLQTHEDQAKIALTELTQLGNRLAFSTDSYVIDPIFFPGGDIGKLAVCGTVNDLAVGGAIPLYLSCGFIIEEGLPLDTLQNIVNSMAQTAKDAGVTIITGDTKVVPHGAADKIFINTAGIGTIPTHVNWGMTHIKKGDKIIVSGTVGDHGATILNIREKLGLIGALSSDCAPLYQLIRQLHAIEGVRALRDATRGGVNAVLHEFMQGSGLGMQIKESELPLQPTVRGLCELLGLDPLNFANEGKVVIVVSPDCEQRVLQLLHSHPLGINACVIGEVVAKKQVTLQGLYGIERLLDLPHNEPLPRIC
ncbi:hydrogenase expression/formation protein HypE [Orbus sturtevantii]|uniref:hydrogenase expression/formation protein HypE n=1 Tax=Orbus sturtevantii TaxID=3074109 RepID=UPI00370DB3B6